MVIMKIVYSMIVNRTLGPGAKGAFELIQLAPNTLSMFGNFGFDQANVYFAGKRPKDIPALISNSYRLVLIFSIPAILLGAGYMLLPANRKIFDEVPMWAGFLALAVIPIAILDMLLGGIPYGENRIWVRNVHEFLRVFSALLYIGILVLGIGWAVKGAIIGFLLINITILAFTLLVLNRYHKIKGGIASKLLALECFGFGGFTWGANFASYLFYNIDRWLLNALAHGTNAQILEQVGLYGTAVSIIVNIWIIPDSIQTALLPKITMKGEEERKKLVPPSLRAVTILVMLSIIALALIGKPALAWLYNSKKNPQWDYTLAYTPLVLLLPGIFTLSLAKVFTADFFSRGKPYYAMWVSIFSLVLNVILNVILIPSSIVIKGLSLSGMNGAAIASSISYTFSFLLFLYLYVRESGEKSRDILLPKKEDFILLFSWLAEAGKAKKKKPSIDIGEVDIPGAERMELLPEIEAEKPEDKD
jgi:O-antigen/teichoic acid export membrane protein